MILDLNRLASFKDPNLQPPEVGRIVVNPEKLLSGEISKIQEGKIFINAIWQEVFDINQILVQQTYSDFNLNQFKEKIQLLFSRVHDFAYLICPGDNRTVVEILRMIVIIINFGIESGRLTSNILNETLSEKFTKLQQDLEP